MNGSRQSRNLFLHGFHLLAQLIEPAIFRQRNSLRPTDLLLLLISANFLSLCFSVHTSNPLPSTSLAWCFSITLDFSTLALVTVVRDFSKILSCSQYRNGLT
ncbi:hypothetical protein BDV36DRAFT_116126 [Aspergillus pseudocaelatus]|uniref:Uncharacterized protein n=1 Tax=Aspergillus pseudocaelatus TaxID=1825620 RepID=A0ABQ6WTC0_9EURO|nr:hypothetical protein BDV36DRAFT_116126 [Aspergillus pseudocaelatus]